MILCAGEALIDMLPRETTKGERAFSPYTGGAVFNTAIALSRLGAPTGFFTGLSTDLFGQQLEDALAASDVDASFAARSDRPTTLAFVTLTDGQAKYAFYDENTAGRMLTEDDLPVLSDDVTMVFFGGISLAVEPCAKAYEALALREAGRRIIMIDPNVRPDFIKDEDAYRARIARMIGAADLVKVSDEDLTWLTGHQDHDHAAENLLKTGPKVVFVTEGASGARGYYNGTSRFVASQKVDVVDTVGAGDTFNAGILAALQDAGILTRDALANLTDANVDAALTLGAKAAAVTVSRAGANPPRRDEL